MVKAVRGLVGLSGLGRYVRVNGGWFLMEKRLQLSGNFGHQRAKAVFPAYLCYYHFAKRSRLWVE